jgi:hypothetical protein
MKDVNMITDVSESKNEDDDDLMLKKKMEKYIRGEGIVLEVREMC